MNVNSLRETSPAASRYSNDSVFGSAPIVTLSVSGLNSAFRQRCRRRGIVDLERERFRRVGDNLGDELERRAVRIAVVLQPPALQHRSARADDRRDRGPVDDDVLLGRGGHDRRGAGFERWRGALAPARRQPRPRLVLTAPDGAAFADSAAESAVLYGAAERAPASRKSRENSELSQGETVSASSHWDGPGYASGWCYI